VFTTVTYFLAWALPVASLPAPPLRAPGEVVLVEVAVPQDTVPTVFVRAFGVPSIHALLERLVGGFQRVSGNWQWPLDGVSHAALRWARRVPVDMTTQENVLVYYGGVAHVAGAGGLFSCGCWAVLN